MSEGQGKNNISRRLKQPLWWDEGCAPPLIPPVTPRPSVTKSSRAIPSHPGRNQYLAHETGLNKQYREKHGPASRAKAPVPLPHLPLSTQHKVNELTTFPSNFTQRTVETCIQCFSPQGRSDVSIAGVMHEREGAFV